MSLAKPQSLISQDITGLLLAWRRGDQSALEQLTPLVFAELHRLARADEQRARRAHAADDGAGQ